VGASYNALGSGLLPFSAVLTNAPSSADRKALMGNQERSRLYDLSGKGVNGTISSADAKKLSNLKGYIPNEWKEATLQFEGCAVVLGAVPGSNHATVTQHTAALQLYGRMKTRLQAAMNSKFGPMLAPALLVLCFHLNIQSWFEERWSYNMSTNGHPELMTGLRSYMRSNRFDWLPSHDNIPRPFPQYIAVCNILQEKYCNYFIA